MGEEKFYTREELTSLSDLALIEVRSRYQHLYALLEGEDSADGSANREQIEKVLRGLREEMRARGLITKGTNRS